MNPELKPNNNLPMFIRILTNRIREIFNRRNPYRQAQVKADQRAAANIDPMIKALTQKPKVEKPKSDYADSLKNILK